MDSQDITKSEHDVAEVISTAGELLASRFGGSPELTDPEDLGGSSRALVLRLRVSPNPFLPVRSLVVKRLPESSATGADPALLREIVAYQFATSLPEDVRPGPELLAHDVDRRIIVLSDAGDAPTLADIMDGGDAEERRRALRSLGAALGRMHAGTADREDGFNTLLSRMWSRYRRDEDVSGERDRGIVRAIEAGMGRLETAGLEVSDGVRSLAAEAARRISSGHHRAFTPFDLAPDNIMMAHRIVFLDYEWAGFRDATFDVASVIAGFPLHVFTEPPTSEEVESVVRSWVEEVRPMWPGAVGDQHLRTRLMTALLGWTLISITVMHYGTPQAALSATVADDTKAAKAADSRTSGRIGGGALERRDVLGTARALEDFSAGCEDPRSGEVADFARAVIDLVSAE
ncbi:phosphotransferase [uncultured Corynebacterium sp.]|uniref:phosphotransferase n=1 Tax=uncultured Corynebacterium sp. TaxID=159447 RepID=UPI0025D62C2B|nr:phosphotransferase [uncultured Corynebacterium sp.]